MRKLRIVSWNIKNDARHSDDLWERAHKLIADLEPDILLRQEIDSPLEERGPRIEKRLGMVGHWAESPRGHHDGIFVRDPLVISARHHKPPVAGVGHAVANVSVRIPGAVTELNLASVHLAHMSPSVRQIESEILTTLADHRRASIVGGDFNSYVATTREEPLPELEGIADKVHQVHRMRRLEDGTWVPDTLPDEILTMGGFVDLARLAFDTLDGHEGCLEGRAPSQYMPWQGRPRRIDRIYSTGNIAPALIGFAPLVGDEIGEYSDHPPMVADLALDRLIQLLNSDACAPWRA